MIWFPFLLWECIAVSIRGAKDINALVGSSIELPCIVDAAQCGELHSVKWYRDTSRIYVYSQFGLVSRAEGNATKRMTVEYELNNTEALLKINKVELQDEASYKCEITYLEVRENCDVVQIIKLQTMVQPEPPRIYSTLGDPHQKNIENTKFGPFDEGTGIELVCQASAGKPKPIVKWYNGSQEMRATYETTPNEDGLFTTTSRLNIALSRGDLGAHYECKVTSAALKEPMIGFLNMDVHVKPMYMKLEYQEQVVQGNDVLLICDVFGANPAADVKWFNNSNLITNESLIHTVPEAMSIVTKIEDNRNGTFTTKSHLQFKATRYDNKKNFHCYAENSVILNQQSSFFHKQVLIQVKYPPVVTVNPENTTVNESAQNILIGCRYTANPMELKAVVWTKNGKNLTLTKDKYEGGTIDHPPLRILNVTRHDIGEYTCICMNDVGASESENSAYLNVQYPPTVEVIMDPETPVKAGDEVNVTAMCSVVSGNPPTLLKVRWFLGDDLLKELPECNYTSNDVDGSGGLYCNVDPSILSLVTVDQSFAGNYTCQGMNIFDWGSVSDPTELVVYYPPSSTHLTYTPSKVIKRGQVDLNCKVEKKGRPENLTYVWYRGVHRMSGITSSKLTINPVKLDTRNNFTCFAMNEGGMSEPSTVFINVSAPPTFINSLKYQHVRSFQNNMSLTCRVECSPLCYISWFKENEQIDTRNNVLYDVKTTIRDANAKTGDFESIESTLIWNVEAWTTHPFAKTAPPAHYSCISSANSVGNGVNASVTLEVEYPPEQLVLSSSNITVTEGKIPPTVVCMGKAFPNLRYEWRKNATTKILSTTQSLKFEDPVTRLDSGNYICKANNTHGNATTVLSLEVQYPPECLITKGEYNRNSALVCIVDARPLDVTFNWKIQGSNDSSEEQFTTYTEGYRGFLILDSSSDALRTYQCYANNSAGMGSPCEIKITGVAAPWWHVFGSDNILILVAIIIGIILCAIFVCIIIIIIICVCKRRRARNKYNNPVEMEEREKPDGHSPVTSGGPLSKWPLKPGVLVHVNSMRNLNVTQIPAADQFKTAPPPKRERENKYMRSKNKVYARLERLRDILGFGDQELVPNGIYHGPGGVTFKKFNPSPPTKPELPASSRKRKKPGYVPNQSTTADRGRPGGPMNDGSTDPLTNPDKGFYENLPFHGMQTPPNKPMSIIAPFIQGNSRNLNTSTKSLLPATHIPLQYPIWPYNANYKPRSIRPVQRHQSFHGFGTPQFGSIFMSRNLNFPFNRIESVSNLLPASYQKTRVIGRKEQKVKNLDNPEKTKNLNVIIQTVNENSSNILKSTEKRFGSLELKKHKCYSPTFYSMRCKKHAKKRSVIYAIPKKTKPNPENSKSPTNVFVFNGDQTDAFQKLTDSIQIMEQNDQNADKQNSETSTPKPAPRCKRHRKNSCRIYENVSAIKTEPENLDSSNTSSENGVEVSVTEALVHNPSVNHAADSNFKRSPTVRIVPNKRNSVPKRQSPKTDDLIPVMPLLDAQNKWTPKLPNANQNAFYTLTTPHFKHVANPQLSQQYAATIPHQKHMKLIPRTLFQDQQISKSKSFSSRNKQKKHFQIPLQKCHSFKFQTAESYFQPIKNVHEENLMRNGYVSDFGPGYPDRDHGRMHKRDKYKNKGPLVLRRLSDYEQDDPARFQENMHSMVQLQYPQPLYCRNAKKAAGDRPNGLVYADLDMPKSSNSSNKKNVQTSSPLTQIQKTKPKTEYATLNFNEVGKEIDV